MLDQLDKLTQEAWHAGNIDLVHFYFDLKFEIQRLRVVGKAVAGLYQRTSDEDAWNSLYEALADANLLDPVADEETK